MTYPPTVVCPHCHGLVAGVPQMAGQAVSCPHCRMAFLMPAVASYPLPAATFVASPPPAGKVRLTVTQKGVLWGDQRIHPDVGAAVVLFSPDQRGRIPVDVLFPILDTGELHRLARELHPRGVHVGRIGGSGQLVLNNVQPGRYELLIRSQGSRVFTSPHDVARNEALIETIFAGFRGSEGADSAASPFDFTALSARHDPHSIYAINMRTTGEYSLLVSELDVMPGQEAEFSHHFLAD